MFSPFILQWGENHLSVTHLPLPRLLHIMRSGQREDMCVCVCGVGEEGRDLKDQLVGFLFSWCWWLFGLVGFVCVVFFFFNRAGLCGPWTSPQESRRSSLRCCQSSSASAWLSAALRRCRASGQDLGWCTCWPVPSATTKKKRRNIDIENNNEKPEYWLPNVFVSYFRSETPKF